MPVEGRSPDLGQERKVARPRRLAQGLPTPRERVRKLQTSLQAKAKAEPAFRFYSLWDKICRPDVLTEAYRRCRHNAGAPGADGQTFEEIEEHGVEEWLGELGGGVGGGAEERPLPAEAPPARLDTEEQRRTAAARHSRHFRSCGPDGCAVGNRPHLRDGPAGEPVRFSTRDGCQNGHPAGFLAHHGPRTD